MMKGNPEGEHFQPTRNPSFSFQRRDQGLVQTIHRTVFTHHAISAVSRPTPLPVCRAHLQTHAVHMFYKDCIQVVFKLHVKGAIHLN